LFIIVPSEDKRRKYGMRELKKNAGQSAGPMKTGRLVILIVTALAAAAALAVAVLLLLPRLYDGSEAEDTQYLSEQVPLYSSPNLIYGDPVFPDIGDTITVDVNKAAVDFYNPKNNLYLLVFELAFSDTKEIIYISGRTAPGDMISDIQLTRALAPGEYEALLIIRVYIAGSVAEIVNLHKDMTVIVTSGS